MRKFPILLISISLVGPGACSPPEGKDEPVVVITDDDAGSSEDCGENEAACDGVCSDLQTDPSRCGTCETSCAADEVCAEGACLALPADCRIEDAVCPGGYWCDEAVGVCKPGCTTNAECDDGTFCDLTVHECRCQDAASTLCDGVCVEQSPDECGPQCENCEAPAGAAATCVADECGFECNPGTRLCTDACLADGPAACGPSCEVCAAPANAAATCVDGVCGFECDTAHQLCDDVCTRCPTGAAVIDTACLGTECVVTICTDDHEICGGRCAPCPPGGSQYGCDQADRCIISDCESDQKLCGGTCSTCPTGDPFGTTQCSGANCVLVCDAGYHECAGGCVPDDDVTQCGGSCTNCATDPNGSPVCAQGSCGLACDADYALCGGACAACPTGAEVLATGCDGAACVATSCAAPYLPCDLGCCRAPTAGYHTTSADGERASLALDSKNYPHLVYQQNNFSSTLRHLWWTGREWSDEVVASGGTEPSIVVDSQDRVHLAYYETASADLRYGLRTAAGWTFETPASTGDVGQWPSVAVDAQDRPSMSFYDVTNADLVLASFDGTIWQTDIVVGPDDNGRYSSHVVEAGTHYIAFLDLRTVQGSPNRRIRFAFGTPGNWTTETAFQNVSAQPPTLAPGPTGQFAVAQHGDFRTRFAQSVWTPEEEVSPNAFVRIVDVAYDPVTGLYHEVLDVGDFVYAVRDTTPAWSSTVIDDDSIWAVGTSAQIEIDPAGTRHAFYHHARLGEFRYLTLP